MKNLILTDDNSSSTINPRKQSQRNSRKKKNVTKNCQSKHLEIYTEKVFGKKKNRDRGRKKGRVPGGLWWLACQLAQGGGRGVCWAEGPGWLAAGRGFPTGGMTDSLLCFDFDDAVRTTYTGKRRRRKKKRNRELHTLGFMFRGFGFIEIFQTRDSVGMYSDPWRWKRRTNKESICVLHKNKQPLDVSDAS